jgi:quercetin dioxygenase-like cupin family protein
MEKVKLKTKPVFQKANRSLNSTLLNFNLPILIESMKRKDSWGKRELNAMILLKSRSRQIVLTALHEDIQIDSFQSNDSITFQIIEGRLKFQSQKESVTLETGQLLTLHDNIKYRLTTQVDTVFLLTIAKELMQSVEN